MMKSNIKTNQYFSNRIMFIILAMAFALPISFSSCNDEAFLEEKVYSTPLTSIWYDSQEGLKQGIAGCHQHIRSYWYWGQENQDPIAIWLGGLGTDIAYHGEAPNSNRFLCNYVNYLVPAGGEQGTVDYHWQHAFTLIQRANYVIDGCEKLDPVKWKKAGQKEEYIAEAKFFRAWAYRHLTSFYGRVPVIDYPITAVKTDFERDPLDKAYALMEADLKAGTTDLPRKGAEENTGRLTQGAAWQLLCEVYLAQHKYNEAIQAANTLIDGNYGYALMTERFGGKNSVWGTGDVFWDLFANDNQFNSANTEAIWVIPFIAGTSDGQANHRGGRCWGNAYFRLNHTPDMPNPLPSGQTLAHWSAFLGEQRTGGNAYPGGFTGYTDTLGRGVSWIHPTNLTSYYLWEGNWDNDIRNARHTILRDFYYDNPRSSFHGKKINMKEDYAWWYSADCPTSLRRDLRNDTCQYIFPFFLKKFDPCNVVTNAATSGNGDTFKDIYGMRLAETYLSRAEAYIGLGQNGLAADDINAVRRRAGAHEITAAEATLDFLLDERARELYGEECRHFVLRRTGTLLDRVRRYNNNPARDPGAGLNIMKKHILWPIPQRELDLNIHSQWEQNPGYDPGHPDFNALN